MGTRWNWSRARRKPAAALVLLVLVPPIAAGCTGGVAHPGGTPTGGTAPPGVGATTGAGPAAPAPRWRPVTLPATRAGTLVLRDLTGCAGRWYASGGYAGPDGSTSPQLWTSPPSWTGTDTAAWTALSGTPVSAYGPAHLLQQVACRADGVAAIGSTSGGVHGNARTGTWFGPLAGPLTEIPSGLDLYGGPEAIGTGRITAGPAGWVIEGAWRDANGTAGAAVWVAPDGHTFTIIDADTELESDQRGQTSAQDVLATPAGFVLVGSLAPPGSRTSARVPLAWTSADGRSWQREPVAGSGADEELQRVIPLGTGLLAVGLSGRGFAAWLRTGTTWRQVGRFGAFAGTGLPRVTGLASDGTRIVAAVADGSTFQLWLSRDGTEWSTVDLPVPVPATGQHLVSLAGGPRVLLLAADDRLYASD